MKIAVVGGSGFVGTRLISLLKETTKYALYNIDKTFSNDFPQLTTICNVLNSDHLAKLLSGVDLVVLLAAEHRDDVTPSSLYYDVNVQGMRNTLFAMEQNGVKRIIFTSSVAIYGLDKNCRDETSKADPFNHYGKSKWEAEEVLQTWFESHPDWNINIIRPTVIFGEGNRGNVFNLLRQIASGKFLMIGNGNNQKSMSYIGNITAFIAFLMKEGRNGYHVYNYVDKPDYTTNDLVFKTGNLLNRKIPTLQVPYWLGMLGGYFFDVVAFVLRRKLTISSIRIKKFCAETKYSSEKLELTDFKPPFTLDEGLKKMLEEDFCSKL